MLENNLGIWKPADPPRPEITTSVPLSSIKIEELEEDEEDQDLGQSQLLPEITSKGSNTNLPSQHNWKSQRSQSLSSSQIDLQVSTAKQERSARKKRSLSVGPESIGLHRGSVQRKKLGLLPRMSTISLSQSLDLGLDMKSNPSFTQLISTKSGMTEFWKFLKGKAGEKNWVFWLDAERVKHYEGKEQSRSDLLFLLEIIVYAM